MLSWTKWQKIADKRNWESNELAREVPACYELAFKRFSDEKLRVVYIGETGNLKRRIRTYSWKKSHLSEKIEEQLNQDFHYFFDF